MTSIDKLEPDDVVEMASFLRGHHIWCTARDGRFEDAARMLERLSAIPPSGRVEELERALQAIVDETVFNCQRFAEDTDTDYFLRCFRAVKERARLALGSHNG